MARSREVSCDGLEKLLHMLPSQLSPSAAMREPRARSTREMMVKDILRTILGINSGEESIMSGLGRRDAVRSCILEC